MNRFLQILLVVSFFLQPVACGRSHKSVMSVRVIAADSISVKDDLVKKKRTRFSGNYARVFNDLQDDQYAAAVNNGITPLQSYADTAMLADQLVRLPEELDLYKTYELRHSIPFLVPLAAKLFVDITHNFRDSLYSKGLPLYRLYLTSVLRSKEDADKLRKRNRNASENSTHMYGTTFDISWRRFEKVDSDTVNCLSVDKLKYILGQVLNDLRNQERCYVKHERRQACFHITVQ